MDRTEEFRSQLRVLNASVRSPTRTKETTPGSVASSARTVMQSIQQTDGLIQDNSGSYLALRGGLSDEERDEVDATVRRLIGDCGERIEELKLLAKKSHAKGPTDQQAHCQGIVLLLLEALDEVSSSFQKFKAFRMERAMAQTKRLQPLGNKSKETPCSDPLQGSVCEIEGLTEEEQNLLAEENNELQAELESKLEKLMEMEKELAQVTSMCELTSQKIQEQASEIDALYDSVVQSIENIDAGNVQLQKAAEASVSQS